MYSRNSYQFSIPTRHAPNANHIPDLMNKQQPSSSASPWLAFSTGPTRQQEVMLNVLKGGRAAVPQDQTISTSPAPYSKSPTSALIKRALSGDETSESDDDDDDNPEIQVQTLPPELPARPKLLTTGTATTKGRHRTIDHNLHVSNIPPRRLLAFRKYVPPDGSESEDFDDTNTTDLDDWDDWKTNRAGFSPVTPGLVAPRSPDRVPCSFPTVGNKSTSHSTNDMTDAADIPVNAVPWYEHENSYMGFLTPIRSQWFKETESLLRTERSFLLGIIKPDTTKVNQQEDFFLEFWSDWVFAVDLYRHAYNHVLYRSNKVHRVLVFRTASVTSFTVTTPSLAQRGDQAQSVDNELDSILNELQRIELEANVATRVTHPDPIPEPIRRVSIASVSSSSRSDSEPPPVVPPTPVLPHINLTPAPARTGSYYVVVMDWLGAEHGELDVYEGDHVYCPAFRARDEISRCQKVVQRQGNWYLEPEGPLPTIFISPDSNWKPI